MTSAKPHFRYDYRRRDWRAVYYSVLGNETWGRSLSRKRLCRCEICSGPAVKHGIDALCKTCSDARYAEIKTQRCIFVNARNAGKIGRLDGQQCVDCSSPSPATDWEHRDWREPLKVEPVCRMHNARRGRAMTAHEASFRVPA